MGDVRKLFGGMFLKPHDLQNPSGENIARITGFHSDTLKSRFSGEEEDVTSIRLAEYDKRLKLTKTLMEHVGHLLGTYEDSEWIGRDVYLVAARIRGNDGTAHDVVDVAGHLPPVPPQDPPKDEAKLGVKGAEILHAWLVENGKKFEDLVKAIREKDIDDWGQVANQDMALIPRWTLARYLPSVYKQLPPPETESVDTDTGEVTDFNGDIPF